MLSQRGCRYAAIAITGRFPEGMAFESASRCPALSLLRRYESLPRTALGLWLRYGELSASAARRRGPLRSASPEIYAPSLPPPSRRQLQPPPFEGACRLAFRHR
jgi:hypothetical protein